METKSKPKTIVKPENNATLQQTTNLPLMQAGFVTPPFIEVSLIVGFTINSPDAWGYVNLSLDNFCE